MDREQEIRRFFLLQVNDALFPIGGYSHSQGLETYIQQGSVCDEKTAAEYIHKKLRFALAYTDLLAVRLAWELADQSDADGLDGGVGRDLVHDLRHDLLHDRPKSSRADLTV